MANSFFNMFAKNVLLVLVLSNIVNVDGMASIMDVIRWIPFSEKLQFNYCYGNIPIDRLDNKTVIVTGSSSGIGEAVALDFFMRGALVLMACRDEDKTLKAIERIQKKATDKFNKRLKKQKFGKLIYHHLDLSDLTTVRRSANQILESYTRIDILVNNAGLFMSEKELSENGYEIHLAVNHLGHFLFTLLLLRRIQISGPGRIINVSSEEYKWGDKKMHLDDINLEKTKMNSIKKYGRSKLANLLFTTELAKRLDAIKDNNVMVYAVYPGLVYTKIWRNTKHYKKPLEVYTKYTKFKPERSAQTIVFCALDNDCANHNGSYYKNCRIMKPESKVITDKTTKELYDYSCKMVKLTDYEDPFNTNK